MTTPVKFGAWPDNLGSTRSPLHRSVLLFIAPLVTLPIIFFRLTLQLFFSDGLPTHRVFFPSCCSATEVPRGALANHRLLRPYSLCSLLELSNGCKGLSRWQRSGGPMLSSHKRARLLPRIAMTNSSHHPKDTPWLVRLQTDACEASEHWEKIKNHGFQRYICLPPELVSHTHVVGVFDPSSPGRNVGSHQIDSGSMAVGLSNAFPASLFRQNKSGCALQRCHSAYRLHRNNRLFP